MSNKEFVTIISDDGIVTNQKIDFADIPDLIDWKMTILRIQNGKIVYAKVDKSTDQFIGFLFPEELNDSKW